MLGIPEKPMEDIALADVCLRQYPWEKPAPDARSYSDFQGTYPDAHMIDAVGPSPAYGLWARHARNITLSNFQILPDGKDSRPAFIDDGM